MWNARNNLICFAARSSAEAYLRTSPPRGHSTVGVSKRCEGFVAVINIDYLYEHEAIQKPKSENTKNGRCGLIGGRLRCSQYFSSFATETIAYNRPNFERLVKFLLAADLQLKYLRFHTQQLSPSHLSLYACSGYVYIPLRND